jgi:hypothetical protein
LLLAASGNLAVKSGHVQLARLLQVFDGSIALFFVVMSRIPFIQSRDFIMPAIFNLQATLIWLISYDREFPSAARDILNHFLWLNSIPFPGYFDILRLSTQKQWVETFLSVRSSGLSSYEFFFHHKSIIRPVTECICPTEILCRKKPGSLHGPIILSQASLQAL